MEQQEYRNFKLDKLLGETSTQEPKKYDIKGWKVKEDCEVEYKNGAKFKYKKGTLFIQLESGDIIQIKNSRENTRSDKYQLFNEQVDILYGDFEIIQGADFQIIQYDGIYNVLRSFTPLIDDQGVVVIPATIGGYEIHEIGARILKDRWVDEVRFENTETLVKIGDMAFYESPLRKITIPSSVITIGKSAFNNSYNLQMVEFGIESQLSVIEVAAFLQTRNLMGITIPKHVLSIENQAFAVWNYYWYQRFSLHFESESSLKEISHSAFFNRQIQDGILHIPDSVEIIGSYAFYNSNIQQLLISKTNSNLKFIGWGAFRNNSIQGTISFPDALVEIQSEAFHTAQFSNIYFGKNIVLIIRPNKLR
jgi:hypothetical protein